MFRIPVSTYRLQFNGQFTFADARHIAGYLARLGISDLYSSPLLRARKGSTHGYDIVDANVLNPELGGAEEFDALCAEMKRHDLGLLLDIVPNHMAASHENAWWMSVLENGPQSRFLHYFDITWGNDKVLLPILGRPYGEVLDARELKLGFDADGFFILYFDKRLPLAPQSYHLVLRDCVDSLPGEGIAIEIRDLVQNEEVIANSRFMKETLWRVHEQVPAFREALQRVLERFNEEADQLDALLALQWYRLAYWRIASETINYRRFFDVTDLVGVRVENPEVFEARNRLILDLIAAGKVTGARIDHIDGLFDPHNYLNRLQLRLGDPSTEIMESFYVIVEKILARGETLPAFCCAGTTGYDFLGAVNSLLIDAEGLPALTAIHQQFTGITTGWADLVYERKKQVIDQLFYGEMRALGTHLGVLAAGDRNARDLAPSELLAALIEITACMPVYRTYVREGEVRDPDRSVLERAVGEARRRAPGLDGRLFDFLRIVLLVEPRTAVAGEREKWLAFVMRWQQFTGRVMAKGVEDTAFYNDFRLISLNEVGSEPGGDGESDPVAAFHARNERIARDWPHTMNATSTHDTKRAEDARTRIDVLSEIPMDWQRQLRRWSRLNQPLQANGVPHANEEVLIYQTLLGMWPLDESELAGVPERLVAYLEKAAREAKTHSSWLKPDLDYEERLKSFATAILRHPPFVESFGRFQRRIAFHGFLNSLSQIVLKVCSPGIPDFYQGTELWDFSLVDPDNRRPVDYEKRMAMFEQAESPAVLLRRWQDGRIKMFVTARSLAARARHLDAFRGSYRALETGTPNAVAFLRGEDVLVVVPRLTTRLVKPPRLPLGDVWREYGLTIHGRWRNAFTGEVLASPALRDVFATFPVAVLERE